MSGYALHPRAEADLEEIWRYSVEHWGEAQTERYMHDLREAMERAAETPTKGQRLNIGSRTFHVRRAGSHRIFYRMTEHGIDVLRVLHARMDFGRHLG